MGDGKGLVCKDKVVCGCGLLLGKDNEISGGLVEGTMFDSVDKGGVGEV
jgi:hypothetical protein